MDKSAGTLAADAVSMVYNSGKIVIGNTAHLADTLTGGSFENTFGPDGTASTSAFETNLIYYIPTDEANGEMLFEFSGAQFGFNEYEVTQAIE